MNPQLNHIHAQERAAEVHHAAQRARLATEGVTERNSRERNPIIRLSVRLARLTARHAPSSP